MLDLPKHHSVSAFVAKHQIFGRPIFPINTNIWLFNLSAECLICPLRHHSVSAAWDGEGAGTPGREEQESWNTLFEGSQVAQNLLANSQSSLSITPRLKGRSGPGETRGVGQQLDVAEVKILIADGPVHQIRICFPLLSLSTKYEHK